MRSSERILFSLWGFPLHHRNKKWSFQSVVTQCLQWAALGPGELLWTLTATSRLSGMFSFGFLFAKPAAAVSQDQAREETTLGKEEQDCPSLWQ